MFIAIGLLIILFIWAVSKKGTFFNTMDIKKYFFISSLFSLGLFINRALQPGFTREKFIISFIASIIVLVIFSIPGYLFFNKLCPKRQYARYLYFCAYFIFLLAFSYDYPFTTVRDMFKKEKSRDLQKDMINNYMPTARLFGIKKLNIKLLDNNTPGAFVICQGDYAQVVLTKGLQELLNDKELCFVMAHEFAHYKIGHHTKRILFAISTLFLFFFLTYLFLKVLKFQSSEGNSEFRLFLKFIPLQLLLAALLSLFPLWICRNQEFEADLYAVSITTDKHSALSAFEKTLLPGEKDSIFFKIFEIHPSTEERINKIKAKFP
ncbi:MAG TPA: M48 family metalloprotease [Candidatus Eremiobacteraeota bacterium]|nr:MAG: M48 family peptidase [bacterium ADurb.Bin363]HPZ09475.1 M48 family metalloprotease [Candidatus Eremiobacteraeota bacterium]